MRKLLVTPNVGRIGFALLVGALASAVVTAAEEVPRRTFSNSGAAPQTLTILHTNDIHGHLESWAGWDGELAGKQVGGLDRLAALIRKVRNEVGGHRVLLLDAGDTIGDTMIAAETQGRAVIETMNAMAYDAMVIGNHEPDFTGATLRARIAEAHFPVLAANIRGANNRLFAKPYVIREIEGIRVGILGIAYPNTPLTSAKRNVAGLHFLGATKTAGKYVPIMRREGAKIIIALTHLGLSADKALAEAVPGIDLIVGGHSHNRMKDAIGVRDTLIVQAGAHGSDLGRLDLGIDRGRIISHRRTLIPITGEDSDTAVAQIIARTQAPYRERMDEHVGRATGVIIRAQTIAGQEPEKRDAESPADDLFADAIRETTRSDIAFLPGLGYGIALQPGKITAAQLRNLIPHESAVWVMQLTGTQIRQVLEQAIENFMSTDVTRKVGGMIQVSGLRFSYDPEAPPYRRVKEITVGNRELAPAGSFTVAVNALLAEGGHDYKWFKHGAERRDVGMQYELVKSWIERHGEVSAPPTDRITKWRISE